jgi:hypothetical protein
MFILHTVTSPSVRYHLVLEILTSKNHIFKNTLEENRRYKYIMSNVSNDSQKEWSTISNSGMSEMSVNKDPRDSVRLQN